MLHTPLPVQYEDADIDIITAIQKLNKEYQGRPLTQTTLVTIKHDLVRALKRAVAWEELREIPGFDIEAYGEYREVTIIWHDPTFWSRWQEDHWAKPVQRKRDGDGIEITGHTKIWT